MRILIADDFAPWRSEVRSSVRCQRDWDIVFEARDRLEAVQKIAELQPDVVLMDPNMPGSNGIEATRTIRQLSPDCIIIMLTQYADEDLNAAALSAGAVAGVLKSEMTTELIPAVRLALRKLGLGRFFFLAVRPKFFQRFAVHHKFSAPTMQADRHWRECPNCGRGEILRLLKVNIHLCREHLYIR